VAFRHGGEAIVTFTEAWAWQTFHYAGAKRRRQHHLWRFAVLPGGRVVVVGSAGDFPPQWVI
jgi:hypothetical protein